MRAAATSTRRFAFPRPTMSAYTLAAAVLAAVEQVVRTGELGLLVDALPHSSRIRISFGGVSRPVPSLQCSPIFIKSEL